MDIINEEEQQFLKTLSHGKRLFEKTARSIEGKQIPGIHNCYSSNAILKANHGVTHVT